MSYLKILLVGVIGYLIVYFKFLKLYGYWLKEYGFEGYYVLIDVVLENFEVVLCMMFKMGFVGVNVIIFYKECVLEIVD